MTVHLIGLLQSLTELFCRFQNYLSYTSCIAHWALRSLRRGLGTATLRIFRRRDLCVHPADHHVDD